MAAGCPAWCAGHPDGQDPAVEGMHSGLYTELRLSLGKPYEMAGGELGPDHVSVSTWKDPQQPAATVSLMHGATDHYLPDMTPGEAIALASALVRAACRIQPAAVQAIADRDTPHIEAGSCPPWCTRDGHDEDRGRADDIHHSAGVGVPVADTRHSTCCYRNPRRTPYVADECSIDVAAQLVLADSGETQLELYHGDDLLPALTMAAAEALAWQILGLTCAAGESGALPN